MVGLDVRGVGRAARPVSRTSIRAQSGVICFACDGYGTFGLDAVSCTTITYNYISAIFLGLTMVTDSFRLVFI